MFHLDKKNFDGRIHGISKSINIEKRNDFYYGNNRFNQVLIQLICYKPINCHDNLMFSFGYKSVTCNNTPCLQ